MSDFLTSYGLFLAELLTLLIALAGLVVLAAYLVLITRRRSRGRVGLQVRSLNRRYDEMARAVRAQVLPKRTFKRELKTERRRLRAEAKEREALGPGDRRPRLFVLDFQGDLRASQVGALRQEVTALLTTAGPRDEVLVRLENTGGLVHDHGLAASQLLRLTERGIRLTVAVDKVAASGGYMMACAADRILAAPFAVVGSIGVIAQVPNFHRLLDRHGVDYEQFKGGEFKRTVTMFGRTTQEEREKLTEEIQDVHALFKEFVAARRPQLDIEVTATGEHWYGARAVTLRLVDELVTSDDYLMANRDRVDIYEVRYGRPRSPAARLTSLAASLTNSLA